jgi:hypothetical protein
MFAWNRRVEGDDTEELGRGRLCRALKPINNDSNKILKITYLGNLNSTPKYILQLLLKNCGGAKHRISTSKTEKEVFPVKKMFYLN